jgi:hypothetical protein
MKKLFSIYNKIEVTSKSSKNKTIKQDNNKFLKIFNDYFLKPPRLNRENSFESIVSRTSSKNPFDGGAVYPYQRRNSSPYVSNFIKNSDSSQIDTPQSNISYYITIDMELQKGVSLSPKDLSNLKCRKRWNSVRKSYADLRGLKYSPTPDYNNLPLTKKENSKNSKSKTQRGGLGLLLNKSNNKTRKHFYK